MAQKTKHNWTEQELWVVCICYKENLPIDLALRLTNTTNRKSMEMRYRNCLYLDKGNVENALSHASFTHQRVWAEVEQMYETIKTDAQVVSTSNMIDYLLTIVAAVIFVSMFMT